MNDNLVEMIAADDELYPAPCVFGQIVKGHACYCHHPRAHIRKCPIWRSFGEHDLKHWCVTNCKYFRPQKGD